MKSAICLTSSDIHSIGPARHIAILHRHRPEVPHWCRSRQFLTVTAVPTPRTHLPNMAATTPDTWEGGEVVEEAITVNQRALIDKILARYAAEFTLLRELLQNADDAEAHTCRLLFSSRPKASPRTEAVVQRIRPPSHAPFVSEEPSAHPNEDIDLAAPLHHWIFQNDGKAFSPDDWNRLRVRIPALFRSFG